MTSTATTTIARVWIPDGNESGEHGFVVTHNEIRAEDVRWSHIHEILGMLGHTETAIATAIEATETAERFTSVTV